MSDIPQAPDWWQASDGKWYPPQAGQPSADPFEQMQQGSAIPPGGAPPFTNLGGGSYQVPGTGRGCTSLGMIITISTLLIGGIITAVVLFAVKDASDTIDETFDTNDEAIESVEVTDCSKDESSSLGWGTATLEVTNDTDTTSTYFIDVTFESRNGQRQFGTGHATVSSLAPGRTTEVEAESLAEVPRQFTCTVTSVDRIGN